MGLYRSFVVITLFVTLFLRVIYLAEKKKFSRVYGYCAVCTFFVNIAMVVGVFQQLSTTTFLLLRRIWTLRIYNFVVYIPENGCQ
jgi:FtsH-binding integral membrane protein